MNENAVKWINRIPLRSAVGGFVIGVVATLLMAVRMLWYQGDEPVFGMTLFLGVVWTILMIVIATSVGLAERGYLSRLRTAGDLEAASAIRRMPLIYAGVGVAFAIMLSVAAYREFYGTRDWNYALWGVGVTAVSIAVAGLLLGLRLRWTLLKLLIPGASSAPSQANVKTASMPRDAANPFANVWLATRARIESGTRFKMYDDCGALERAGDTLRFNGRKRTLVIRDITAVQLVRQRPNWMSIGIALAATALLALGANYVDPSRSLTADLLVLAAAALFGLYINAKLKWVCVSFRDENGTAVEACFTDGSSFGWGGIAGGTKRLFDALATTKHANAPAHAGA